MDCVVGGLRLGWKRSGGCCRELTRNSQPVRNKKQRKHMPKKNSHTHKTIFTWFDNLRTSTELQGFYYYQEKYKVRQYSFFFFSLKNYNNKTLITKAVFSISYTQDLQQTTKRPKPPLHGPSIKKSLIKNHATLFRSGWVVKPNQTKLVSTKPNKSPTWRLFNHQHQPQFSKTQSLIPATHPPAFKLEDQLKLNITSASQQ